MNPNDPTAETLSDGDDSGAMGAPTPEPTSPQSGEICVPLTALAMPDESEAMQPPADGDKVQGNFEATVSRSEGDKAYIKLTSINGEPLASETPAPVDDASGGLGDLQSMAANLPPT